MAQDAGELLAAGSSNGVGGAFGTSAVTACRFGNDEAVALEAPNGVIEGTALEGEDLVLVAKAEEAPHLIGMHWLFTKKGEDGDFPDSEFSHIVQMNYIE